MKFRIGRFLFTLCIVFVFSAVLALTVFGETLNSNVFAAEQKSTFEDFSHKSLSTTANLNWRTANGSKITKTTVKNLPSYLLTVNAVEGKQKATFISSPRNPLDISQVAQLYFVVQYAADEKVEYTVNLSLSDGADRLVCSAPLKGNSRQLVSFEIGFFSPNRIISELSLEFLSEEDGGKISISGPYYAKIDRTYADKFSLGDAELSLDASDSDEGIFVADSTQKTGFSGRLLRPADTVPNHLRLFVTTGAVGGIMEIRYSYFNDSIGGLATKSINVTLENNASSKSYIVPLEYADKIVSLSFLFDVAREGGVIVHGIESIDIYAAQNRKNFGRISRCTYASSEGSVTVKGEVFHDFLIKHADYTLYLYRLETSETANDAVLAGDTPISSAKMSSEFEMHYKPGRQDKLAAVSLYALVASDGEDYIEILPCFHLDTYVAENDSGRSFVKGASVDLSSELIGMGFGSSVVDVYLDKLVCDKKSGYIYSLGDTHVYFDSAYVHGIDKQVKERCVAGEDVYLRLLIGADGNRLSYASEPDADSSWYAIEVKNERARTELFIAIDFLSGRYSDHTNGKVSGYVIGEAANRFGLYGSKEKSISKAAVGLGSVIETVVLSAAVSMPGARILLPISLDGGYDPELFLKSVCNRLDEIGGLPFAVMVESSRIYFSGSGRQEKNVFSDISKISNDILELSRSSNSVISDYMYSWTPDEDETDEKLIPSYIYTYMLLFSIKNCNTFLLSVPQNGHYDLFELVKTIDTKKNENGELTNFVLDMLGVSEWDEAIPGFVESDLPVRIYETVDEAGVVLSSGEFVLFDFSTSFGPLGWFAGTGCDSVVLASNEENKILCAKMNNANGVSELLYHFDHPEKLSMAPYMKFEFSAGNPDGEKYSVAISVRSGNNVLVARQIFTEGERCVLTVDLSSIAASAPIDSICIGVSDLSEEPDTFEFRLSSVSVLSETMNDAELAKAIKQSRDEAKNTASVDGSDREQSKPDYEFIFILAAVLVVCVFVVGIYDRSK